MLEVIRKKSHIETSLLNYKHLVTLLCPVLPVVLCVYRNLALCP